MYRAWVHILQTRKDRDTERQFRPRLSKAENPILNFGENPWLRKWALWWRVGGLKGQGASGQITYPNMKGGRKEDGRKRGGGRKGEKEKERRSKRGKSEVVMDLNPIDSPQSKFRSVLGHNPLMSVGF